MNVNEKLRLEVGTKMANPTLFRSLVSGLIYLMHTQPDITYSVGVVLRFMHASTKHYFDVAKRILHHIARTLDYEICYSYMTNFKLFSLTDSD